MILISIDRRDTTVCRVLPKIERLGGSVTRWDNGACPAGSRVTAVAAASRVTVAVTAGSR
ncbi:hypothetical protein [Microbispora sp. NPDC049633]|uniref:hypothetical protein n=1 Tax=Microbispora sp. NPDC049633 TaxID=3154355 RepID=UPI00341A9407